MTPKMLGVAGLALETLTTGPSPMKTATGMKMLAVHLDDVLVDAAGEPYLPGVAGVEALGDVAVAAALVDRVRIDVAREARGEGAERRPVRNVARELTMLQAELLEQRNARESRRTLDSILSKEGFIL